MSRGTPSTVQIDQCIYTSTERTWMPSLIILLSWMDQIRAAERDGEVVMFGMWRTTHATHVVCTSTGDFGEYRSI